MINYCRLSIYNDPEFTDLAFPPVTGDVFQGLAHHDYFSGGTIYQPEIDHNALFELDRTVCVWYCVWEKVACTSGEYEQVRTEEHEKPNLIRIKTTGIILREKDTNECICEKEPIFIVS